MNSQETQNKNVSYPAQITVILRLAASGYLLYLAYGLLQEVLKSSGQRQQLQISCMLVFVLAGGILGIWSLKKMIKKEYRLPGQTEDI
ncbi:MAG: hypothetical protein ACRDBO_22220 [Lachnospiraceae bacterium]